MGAKSRRQKEQYAERRNKKLQRRKRQEARERQSGFARRDEMELGLGGNARHRERLSRQIPLAWPGELPEDAAVFKDAAFSSLLPDLVPQVTAVREALEAALACRGDDALKGVSEIPRGSPLSEWRLFIRGLVDWLTDQPAAASDTWKRLDPQRRPGRIATAMMVALRSDLEHATPFPGQPENEPGDGSEASAWDRFDAGQLYHAKLLRRVRFDRQALQVAERGLSVPEESEELLLGPAKIKWLGRFVAEYGDTEPDLATALAQAALARAFSQDYSNLFDETIRIFHGPRHDRHNRLLTFFYYGRFANNPSAEKRRDRALNEYLNRDLPQNESLSESLRGAIASHIHLNEAVSLMRPTGDRSVLDFFNKLPPENAKAIRDHLRGAVKAAPAHSAVYKIHAGWIDSKLDNDRLGNAERTRLEGELAEVMGNWSQGVPDDPEPRLWLVDYLLENERLDEARPHVDFLAASRQDNPRVRATPWKWQLLEAMRLCRRKAWLADVPVRLDEAEKLWPAWLSKQWLPYLRAAWISRTGQMEAFEEARRRICEESGRIRDSLADACLMLGAAQLMRATSADLKPLRAAANQALKNIDVLPMADLLETSGFFWDLHRIQLIYPAYRAQGRTIGKALFSHLEKNDKLVLDGADDQRIQRAVLCASEHRFWSDAYETKFPSFFSKLDLRRYPSFAAAKLNALLKERYSWNIEKCSELGPLLREAATSERDAYYRHWYVEMADQLDDLLDKNSRKFAGFPFGNLFGADEYDGADDDLGFDPDCDCPDCQAARKAYEQGLS